MNSVLVIAGNELRCALRNRWVAAITLVFATLALTLALLGAAPGGETKTATLTVTVASLASLSVYLLPLIALMLAFDAIAGEYERGTLLLLFSYPVKRWHAVAGKLLGHVAVLCIAVVIGYGGIALLAMFEGGATGADWLGYGVLLSSSVLLGAVFLSLGYFASAVTRERATAGGIAICVWIVLVVVYDLALLGLALGAHDAIGLNETTFTLLMLGNPADAYRLLNLTGAGVDVSGLAGITTLALSTWVLPLLSMLVWLGASLAATAWILERREL